LLLNDLARLLLSVYVRREHSAAVEMRADAVGQVLTAPGHRSAPPPNGPEKFVLVEPSSARRALRDEVIPAESVEESTLVEAERVRTAAGEVDNAATVAVDRVLGREHLPASRTFGRRCHRFITSRFRSLEPRQTHPGPRGTGRQVLKASQASELAPKTLPDLLEVGWRLPATRSSCYFSAAFFIGAGSGTSAAGAKFSTGLTATFGKVKPYDAMQLISN
jgi:hypothetical protein